MSYGLSLINSGVHDLLELPLTEDLKWISLHSNQITSIESINHLINLTHLDLSANCITRMRGLDGLVSLRVLNLSCNQIKVVEGLTSLRNLKELDLSLNLIEDLTGFQDVKYQSHSLQKIVLFGNNIKSLANSTKCLLGCGKLKVIDFKQGSDENPICSSPNYRQYLFYQLPSLQALDGIKRDGTVFRDKVDIDGIPGIEDYLSLLIPSTDSTEKSTTTVVSTPKLDAALQKFKEVSLKGEEKSTEELQGQDKGNITARLLAIEDQITSFMNAYGPKRAGRPAVTVTLSSTSEDDSATDKLVETVPVRKDLPARKSGVPHHSEKQTVCRKTSSTVKRPALRKQGRREETKKNINGLNTARTKVRDARDDEEYLALMQELESERERRWKAEQASRKFIDQIRQLQDQVSEEQKVSESAIAAAAKLRQTLVSEKEAKDVLQKASDSLKAENEECKASLKSLREADEENRRALKAVEETAMKAERQRIEEQALRAQQIQDLQGKVSAENHEVHLLRASNKEQKEQIQQLQSLIAAREQEHRTKLDGMVHVDSREFQNRLEKELAKQETRQSVLNQQYMNKLAEREREYTALEDEFRLALQIEARRFGELQSSHDQLMTRLKEKSEALELVSQKENKASSLVQELTALVKEQKGRLSEISKAKQEFQVQSKERINSLEEELQELRKLPSRIDSLEQDKGKLSAQIRAQESIIEGLRTERKLWGQELAQQGASLAQDRGRLESKIEALTRDLKQLEKQDEENKETIRIKAKLIEDQTETIKKLKKAVADEQKEKEEAKEELSALQSEIEEEVKAEKVRNEDLQVTIDQLSLRKEDLKEEVSKLRSELDAATEEKKALATKWSETSQLISQMEQKVVKVKETFDTKESKLKKERDDAIEKLNSCSEKLRETQALMRKELDRRHKEYELEYRKLTVSKDKEIESMKEKVLDVEEEMRLLLKETNETKQKLETKINQLSQAFFSIKDDLNV